MQIDDETLMAFADGELTGPEAEAIARAIAVDPALAEKVAQHRRLRTLVADTFDPMLEEQVPPKLMAAATAEPKEKVVDLADARQKRAARIAGVRKAFRERWGSIAAALAVGIIAGQVLGLDRGLVRGRGGELIARMELAEALDEQLASSDPIARGSPVRIGLTFLNPQNQYCRTFSSARADGMSGIACRHDGYWKIRLAAAGAPQPGAEGYRMAGSDAVVLEAAQAMMKGEPLDAAAEARARARAWR